METKMSKGYHNGNGQRTLPYNPRDVTAIQLYAGDRAHRGDEIKLVIRRRDGPPHTEDFTGTDCADAIVGYVTANLAGRRVPVRTDGGTWRTKRVDRSSLLRKITEIVNGNGK